jgi:hypothetical protein
MHKSKDDWDAILLLFYAILRALNPSLDLLRFLYRSNYIVLKEILVFLSYSLEKNCMNVFCSNLI